MSTAGTLEYERRVRPRYAVLAVAGGVLVIAAAVIGLLGPHPKVNELTLELIVAHKRFPLDIISAVVNGFGLVAFALTVAFLAICTRARRPQANPAARIAALAGGGLAAVAGIVYAIAISQKVDDFVSHGTQTYEEAHRITNSTGLVVLPFLGQAAALLLAMGVFFVALNAMRSGLLTRFMGYLGIFVGVLVIFPIGSPVPIVQGFWLIALGVLFSGRWPNGTPAAWESGQAEPWPSSAEMRAQRTEAAGGSRARPARGQPAPSPGPTAEPAGAGARTTRAATPKRKRKKRK